MIQSLEVAKDVQGIPDGWFTWSEICDVCGKKYRTVFCWWSAIEPKDSGKEHCLECLRKLIDKKIVHQDLI